LKKYSALLPKKVVIKKPEDIIKAACEFDLKLVEKPVPIKEMGRECLSCLFNSLFPDTVKGIRL
jgi:hypothetical protein